MLSLKLTTHSAHLKIHHPNRHTCRNSRTLPPREGAVLHKGTSPPIFVVFGGFFSSSTVWAIVDYNFPAFFQQLWILCNRQSCITSLVPLKADHSPTFEMVLFFLIFLNELRNPIKVLNKMLAWIFAAPAVATQDFDLMAYIQEKAAAVNAAARGRQTTASNDIISPMLLIVIL